MERAHSVFKAAQVSEERWELTGIASTPATDLDDDIIDPLGAEFDIPLPLLWQHDSKKPIGHVIQARPTYRGSVLIGIGILGFGWEG